jgi:hypothetical protein
MATASGPRSPELSGPKLCHFCNANGLNPEQRYYLSNNIEVCRECYEKSADNKTHHV